MVRNVYLINLSLGLAGIERRFANIWQELKRRGNVRPILVVPDTLAAMLEAAGLAEPGDPLLWRVREPAWAHALGRVPLPLSAQFAAAFARSRAVAPGYRPVWRKVASDPAAVVHFGLNCSALVPPDVPLVYECVDSTLSQLGTRHYARAAERRCLVNCQTDRIRLELERTYARRITKWTTLTSPNCFASYPVAPVDGVRPEPALIAFVGRLAPEKNPLLLVDAVGQLRASGIPCRVLMLGEGPLLQAVRRRIRELGLDAVFEVTFADRPLDRIAGASIFVSLQSGDNYPSQSLLEAMGAGCAVVATAVGETARLVTPDVGVLVDQDAEQLARALASLLADPARTAALGAAARTRVRTHFTADAYVAFLESLYERAAALHRS